MAAMDDRVARAAPTSGRELAQAAPPTTLSGGPDALARADARGGVARGDAETVELPRTAGPGSGLGGNWRVIVLNDDHNTFDHVAHTLARHIPGVTVDKGYAIADMIHNTRPRDRLERA